MKDEPFYKQIECDHGWTDDLGWDRCSLGSALEDPLGCCFCGKEHCVIYEEDEDEILSMQDEERFDRSDFVDT